MPRQSSLLSCVTRSSRLFMSSWMVVLCLWAVPGVLHAEDRETIIGIDESDTVNGQPVTVVVVKKVKKEHSYTVEEVRNKIRKYTVMRNGGVACIVGGAVLSLVGMGVMANRDTERDDENMYVTTESTDPEGTALLTLVAGVEIAVGGIVLTSIGNRKVHEYKNRLGSMSLKWGASIGRMQMSFVYDF